MANHIGAIHVLKAKLSLCTDDYQALLANLTGKTSSKDMTDAERQKVRDHMQSLAERMGVVQPTRRRPMPAARFAKSKADATPKERKVWALWHQLHRDGLVHDTSPAALNAWVLQTRESSEFRAQTEQMGRSLVEWLRNRYADQAAILGNVSWLAAQDASYPIAFSFAAHCAGASAHDALLAYAFGWAENLVQAAVKAVPLGQSAGQRILARLAAAIPAAADHALGLADDQRQSFSPMLAILSAQHETQYSRLFRS